MRWTKIKDIMILLLVIVNLALLGLVGVRAWRTAQNERQARERMIAILENNSIDFLPREVPDALELSILRFTPEPPGEAQAALLVGEITSTESLGHRTAYYGSEGVALLSPTGEVEVRYTTPALTEDAALERLSALGLEIREPDGYAQEGDTVLTLTQLHQGIPLPGETVTLTFRAGYLSDLSFRLLSGTWESLPTGETVTASTALLRFLDAINRGGYVCSRVTGLYPGYTVSGTGPFTLTPAWYVETDTRPWIFAVDGPTGAVTPLE